MGLTREGGHLLINMALVIGAPGPHVRLLLI